MCACHCVFVCERVPGEGMARLCFAERLPKATRLAYGARVDILLSIICTNNMVTYQQCVIITPQNKIAGST